MRKLTSLLFLLLPFWSYTQDHYLVEYRYSDILMPFTFNGEKRYVQREPEQLVIGDTLAILYRPGNGSVKKNGVYGVKPLHHAYFITVTAKRYYSVVAWPQKNHPYLIADTVTSRNWIITGDSKTILDHNCEFAYFITQANDTVSAWFTREIPFPLGPFMQSGLPGLILEAEDTKHGIHVTAKKILRGIYPVALPEVDAILSPEEYHRTKGKGKS